MTFPIPSAYISACFIELLLIEGFVFQMVPSTFQIKTQNMDAPGFLRTSELRSRVFQCIC